MFVDEGRIAMTNLVFPTNDYDAVEFTSEGKAKVSNVVINQLGK